MIRKVMKSLLKRMAERAPHIPAARSTGRKPPTNRNDWQASSESTVDDESEDLPEVEVEPSDVQAWVEQGQQPLLIDIREPHEMRGGVVTEAWLLPMNTVPRHTDVIPKDRPVVLYCAAGARTYSVAHWLREQGFDNAWSLVGGIGAWLETGADWHVPPSDEPLPLVTSEP